MSVLDQIGDVINKQKINNDIINVKNNINNIENNVTNIENNIRNESLDIISKSFTRLPSVDITIDMTDMSKEVSKDGILKYTKNKFDDFGNITETTTFTDFINMKWQGSSSIYLPKKNFSIKLFTDEAHKNKDNRAMKSGWYSTNKYVLKANYIDSTHARNIICARLWGEVVKSRAVANGSFNECDSHFINLVNGGAIDGYPVKVYINKKYYGLYTLNLPKQKQMFGMGKGVTEGFISDEQNAAQGEFSSPPTFDENDFSIEYSSGENQDWIKSSFINLYNAIQLENSEDFKSSMETLIDKDSVIDYFCFIYYLGLTDNFAKNMLLGTYDGTKWFVSAYDMDNCFGLKWNSKLIDSPESFNLATIDRNKLIRKTRYNYKEQVKKRYSYLRKNVLNLNNLVSKLQNFSWDIPEYLINEESKMNPVLCSTYCNNINQIVTWMMVREKYVDGIIDSL